MAELPIPARDSAPTSEPAVSWSPPIEPTAKAAEPAAKTIDLWTPRGIGWASVILGFPGAAVLAALNWQRMGMSGKAVAHVVAAVLGFWAFAFVANAGAAIVVEIAAAYYLYRIQRRDQSTFPGAGRVTERNGLLGALIAITGTVLVVVSAVPVAKAFESATLQHRGEVIFGARAGSDVCAPAGLATEFGPNDSIFIAAIMRETVKPGSRVVEEIDGPFGAIGSVSVDLQPPYDCFGSTGSLSQLDPGTYTVHVRYDGQPHRAELATGGFVVRSTP